ncbi:MAG TPA: SIS domain-containing protein [Microthrixaceae bacterium]|nr:SIS domain-containing protein [Microthrixaceae bacterium]
MCGIIAVVRRRSGREPVPASSVVDELTAVGTALGDSSEPLDTVLADAADRLEALNTALCGVPGVLTLMSDPDAVRSIEARIKNVDEVTAGIEASLDRPAADLGKGGMSVAQLERTNAALIRCKDAIWAIQRDRLRAAAEVRALVPDAPGVAAAGVLFSLHQALSALDRLEVRGRDSAGIEVQLTGHGLDLDDPVVTDMIAARGLRGFTSGSVKLSGDTLVIVYKAAAEIGELGDNTAALRAAIGSDDLLQMVLRSPDVEGLVLGHTRWASIGIISEPNAHPQCSDEIGTGAPAPEELAAAESASRGQFVTAVLNGDVDNHSDITVSDGLGIAAEITTDAKVIPTLMARGLGAGQSAANAFRETVVRLEGSVAIAAAAASSPDKLFLASRGSGQALYVGLAEDAFIVASEPYGVVEETSTYVRMDGETPADPDNPAGSRGQIVELDASDAGTLAGISRRSYDGTELPVDEEDLNIAQVTTRDIDRGDYPHFLLKEITASPGSFRKTLRGKLLDDGELISVVLGDEIVPASVREGLRSGRIDRIQVIGQGTAAIAGQSLAHHLSDFLADADVRVESILATELSGFGMRADMADTLVIAISQSGTTTDTNRTVDLVRSRGASVIAIVNRRGSDLTDKADGVLYTSDGRDVEMSVASTKAFYSQVAAGLLLSQVIADEVPDGTRSNSSEQQELLRALLELPERMEEALEVRAAAADAARNFGPSRRYWAIVGNGVNQIAAREIRVKLSELCYKSIACDGTEDKKHIDLSSEPLILVCAAGLVGSTADDVSKEVAIFRAHKAAPIVIASEGDRSFPAAVAVLSVPATHPRLAFIMSTMAGHLFGYEAALAIDAQARPLREARAAIDVSAASFGGDLNGENVDGEKLLKGLRAELTRHSGSYMDGLRAGSYNGHLEANTAVRLAGQFRYAVGLSPLDGYQLEFGKIGSPGVVLEDLSAGLTSAIEELTRPVDAIKHQAKTVTVGISRSDESLLQIPLVDALFRSGSPRDRLTYSTLRAVGELNPAIIDVAGFTRYGVEHGDDLERATLVIVDRGGVSSGLPSRVERDPRLRGTKALVAREQELMIAKGRSDGRLVLILPEIKDGVTTGLQLLHINIFDRLAPATARAVMQGYRRRYQALRDAVTETEDVFRDDLLGEQSVEDLLTIPILDLADRWRS